MTKKIIVNLLLQLLIISLAAIVAIFPLQKMDENGMTTDPRFYPIIAFMWLASVVISVAVHEIHFTGIPDIAKTFILAILMSFGFTKGVGHAFDQTTGWVLILIMCLSVAICNTGIALLFKKMNEANSKETIFMAKDSGEPTEN